MVLLGGRSSPPVPPSPKERGASWKGDGGQILTPRSPLSQGEGASWKGEGASWKGEGASWKGDGDKLERRWGRFIIGLLFSRWCSCYVLLLGYYSVNGVLVLFIVSIATTLLLGRGWGRIVL